MQVKQQSCSQQKNMVYALWQEVPKLVYAFWTCNPVLLGFTSVCIKHQKQFQVEYSQLYAGYGNSDKRSEYTTSLQLRYVVYFIHSQLFQLNLLVIFWDWLHGNFLRSVLYSLCQKKRTLNSNFFPGPPGGGGPKIHIVEYVNGSLPQGGQEKNRN